VKRARAQTPRRALPAPTRILDAFTRLAREKALQALVRGGVPEAVLKRLLKNALPLGAAREMPPEIWGSLASGIAVESEVFGMALGQALHDRLAWDKEPASLDEWWELVRERPLEALWMAALSETKAVRKEFAHIAEHCLDNFRASPACSPPSWQFVEGILSVQATTVRELREAERVAEDAERRREAERERLEELREELKRLRRETSELRSEKAQAERRAGELATRAPKGAEPEDVRRVEDLERRLRKSEKEREHLRRELEKLRPTPAAPLGEPPAEAGDAAPLPVPSEPEPSLSADPNPRRRVLRQMLRRLVKKGKIGASHTHEDNVYRGVPDHEKGIAKDAIEMLYREGFLMPKPTLTDPHVSVAPERLLEVRSIVAGEIVNPRLQRFVEG
jgi:hypothetical protein